MDADEVADAFKHLHQSGKVRHFGGSNFTPAQFALLAITPAVYPCHQSGGNIPGASAVTAGWHARPTATTACSSDGVVLLLVVVVSFNDDMISSRCVMNLPVVAEELNAGSIEQVVCAWVLRLPSQPLPIIGSGKIERVRAAVEAETLKMTRQQWFRIRKAGTGLRRTGKRFQAIAAVQKCVTGLHLFRNAQ